jgi:hypothetical protein
MPNPRIVLIMACYFPMMAQVGDSKDSLRTSSGVFVAAKTSGCDSFIDGNQLKQDTELKLRIAGIKVASSLKADKMPLGLTVSADCMDVSVANAGGTTTVGWAIMIEASVSQMVGVFSALSSRTRCDVEATWTISVSAKSRLSGIFKESTEGCC